MGPPAACAHLVGAPVGARAAQPDLVAAEVAGDVGDDAPHGQALAAAVLPPPAASPSSAPGSGAAPRPAPPPGLRKWRQSGA